MAKLPTSTMETFFRKDLVNRMLKTTTKFRQPPSVPKRTCTEITRWLVAQQGYVLVTFASRWKMQSLRLMHLPTRKRCRASTSQGNTFRCGWLIRHSLEILTLQRFRFVQTKQRVISRYITNKTWLFETWLDETVCNPSDKKISTMKQNSRGLKETFDY